MKLSLENKKIIYAAVFPVLFIILIWLIALLKTGMEWDLSFMGIYPRSTKGIIGILTHYLIHGDFSHLWSNTISLIILGWLLFYFYGQIAWRTLGALIILTGIFLWLIGRDGIHVGASGLIYGLTFFLFFSGIFRKYSPLIAVSLIVVFLYGSSTWGIFPFSEIVKPDMSWEGHLSGALSGLITALLLKNKGPQKPPEIIDEEDYNEKEEEENYTSFTEPDHTRSHPTDGND